MGQPRVLVQELRHTACMQHLANGTAVWLVRPPYLCLSFEADEAVVHFPILLATVLLGWSQAKRGPAALGLGCFLALEAEGQEGLRAA